MHGGHRLYFALYIIMAIFCNRRQTSVESLASNEIDFLYNITRVLISYFKEEFSSGGHVTTVTRCQSPIFLASNF